MNAFIGASAAVSALGSAFRDSGGIGRIAAGLAQMKELAGPGGEWNTDGSFMPGGGYVNKTVQTRPALAFDDPANTVRCAALPDPKTWTQSKFTALDDQPNQTWCLHEDEKSWAPLLHMTDLDSPMIAQVPELEFPLPVYDALPPSGIEVRSPAIVVRGKVYRWESGSWHAMHQRGLDALLTPESKYPRKVLPTDPKWASW